MVVHNSDWEAGISSSIRRGIATVAAGASARALVMLADQPRIASAHLRALVDEHVRGNHRITATRYDSVLGVPAVFDELMVLTGDRGAGALIRRNDAVGVAANQAASLDVDTPSQLRALARGDD